MTVIDIGDLLLNIECLNCDQRIPFVADSLLYCSELCKQEAHYVRYSRAATRDGRIRRADVKEALNIQLALIFAGGYPERARQLLGRVRALILARDSGLCRICGAPGTVIDHISAANPAAMNDPENLQLLCVNCHNEKTRAGFTKVSRESDPDHWAELNEKFMSLQERVMAPTPLRLCDDDVQWRELWRNVEAERRRTLAGDGDK